MKTSLSPVSAFLREEVCSVSDHLAGVSKFVSDQWMDALPRFHGWTDTDSDTENVLRDIVKRLPMRNLGEPKDVESPLLRSQIDQSFLRAMAAAKEQMSSGGEEHHYSEKSYGEKQYTSGPLPNQRRLVGVDSLRHSSTKGNRPPRPSGRGGPRPPKGSSGRNNTGTGTTQRRYPNNGYHNNGYPGPNNGYPGMNSMMAPQMNMPMHQNMYQYDPYQAANQSAHYMPPHPEDEYYYGHGGGWVPGPEYDNPNNYSYLDQSMVSQDMQYYQASDGSVHQGNWHPYMASGQDVSVCSNQGEDVSQCSDQVSQIGVPEGVSLSFIGPNVTPSKDRRGGVTSAPQSPCWAHLHTLAMSGLVSPNGRQPPSYYENGHPHGNGQLKPLMINNFNNGHGMSAHVPPSPATQFLMSPQTNSQAHAYFAHGNPPHQYTSPAKQAGRSFSSGEKILATCSDESSSATGTTEASSTGDTIRSTAKEPVIEADKISSSEK